MLRITLTTLFALSLAMPGAAQEPIPPQILAGLATGKRSEQVDAIIALGRSTDAQALALLVALRDGRVHVDQSGGLLIEVDHGRFIDPTTPDRAVAAQPPLSKFLITNTLRRALSTAIAQQQLRAKDPAVRLEAATVLSKSPSQELVEAMRAAWEVERDPAIKDMLELGLAQADLGSGDPQLRLSALRTIEDSADPSFKPQLEALLAKDSAGTYVEADPAVRNAARQALSSIERKAFFVRIVRDLFYGASLGSVLLLAALGLAITFGLMGVINMAHGEMLMIGAYTTYSIQETFRSALPGAQDAYLLAAVPAAFGVCMALGVLIERLVIRFLYGRPLETLLATFGVSLLLIQSVRLLYGASNVAVANPSYLSGGYELVSGVVLPYARIAIVGFVVLVVAFVWYLLNRTNLGLQVRVTTQNRAMAACVGIRTQRIDMVTFGLGSGVAGLGGVALSQIGNVGPELGQSYIVDSFMVVVVGGVGKLVGTVVTSLGLGVVNKVLEPVAGAVLGKILVLGFVILFIQRRPQGLFALKGRSVEQ